MDRTTFDIALAQAQANAPDHHLHRLIKGYSVLSVAYLRKILETMAIPSEVEPIEEERAAESPESLDALKKSYDNLKTLFIDRAKLSNTFHDVVTDEDRAAISRKIQAVQSNIAMEMRAIAHIKEHGVAPLSLTHGFSHADRDGFTIPDNDYELFKAKELLRQSLSRGRINLVKRGDAGKDTTRQEKFLTRTQQRYDESVDVLQRGVFTREEILTASPIERLRMHLIDPDNVDLANTEKAHLHELNKTFHILIEHPRQRIAVQKIKIVLGCENNKAYSLIKQAQDLYSNVLTRNTYFDKIQQRERLLKQLDFCDRTNRIKEVIMIETLISKIDTELHQLAPDEKKTQKALPSFKLSMDPSVLAGATQQFLDQSEEE